VAVLQEPRRQMPADKPAAAGDQHLLLTHLFIFTPKRIDVLRGRVVRVDPNDLKLNLNCSLDFRRCKTSLNPANAGGLAHRGIQGEAS
jgi:hypothetical protein